MKQPARDTSATDMGVATRQFTIKANAKAFRTLIDGIYANKILAPVRELMTNAFDSHIAADIDAPFAVQAPTRAHPMFVVRDYGVGMSHDQIMGGFSTLFESTKDEGNDQVGMMGLGSKSPFAYRDSFTLKCFDGTEVRTYSAHMNDDMPEISLILTTPSTESRGIEVSFPVETQDVDTFTGHIKTMLYGFDTPPTWLGDRELEADEAKWSLDGVRVYDRGHWNDRKFPSMYMVRMGCVLYPVENVYGWDVPQDDEYTIVVDVPIGTTDITTDRERLSDDRVSREAVQSHVTRAWNRFGQSILAPVLAANNQVERAVAAAGVPSRAWRDALGVSEQPTVSLIDATGLDNEGIAAESRVPGNFVVNTFKKKVSNVTTFNWKFRGRYRFIMDDASEKRRKVRVRDFSSEYSYDQYVMVVPEGADQARTKLRLIEECGFGDEHFINMADLYDAGPPERARRGASGGSGINDIREAIKTKPWVQRMRDDHYTTGYAEGGIHRAHTDYIGNLFVNEVLGMNTQDLSSYSDNATKNHRREEVMVCLTESMVAKVKPDSGRAVGVVLRMAWDTKGYAKSARNNVSVTKLRQALVQVMVSSAVSPIMEAEGFGPSREFSEKILGDACQVVHGTGYMADVLELQPPNGWVDAQVDRITAKYPALVTRGHDFVENYIAEVNA